MIIFNKVRWKNLLSTGNNFTELNLSVPGTTLISGKNGEGKSTFIDALTFGLFGKPFRGVNIPGLVNSVNEKGLLVEVEFKIGKTEYFIRRGYLPRVFEIFKNGILIDQDSKSKDYQRHLTENILKMTYKSFCQVIVLGSGNYVPFMQLTANDRRQVVESLLDISIFSSMNVLLKGKMSLNEEEIKALEYDISLLKEKIVIRKKYIQTLRNKSKENVAKNREEIKATIESRKKVETVFKETAQKIQDFQQKITDEPKTTKKLLKLEDVEKRISKNIRVVKKSVDFYNTNQSCPTCFQEISEDFRQEKIDTKKQKVEEYETALKETMGLIADLEKRVSEINEVNTDISKLRQELSGHDNTIKANNDWIAKLEKEITEILNTNENIVEETEKETRLQDKKDKKIGDRSGLVDTKFYYNIASGLLKDTGIKTKIIKHYLPIMNKIINGYLAHMDFFVQFTLDESFNETIKSRYRDKFSYMNFSEGEKRKIDLALLFAWREIARRKNSANTNILVLDEIFDGALDADGTDNFLGIINTIDDDISIFVISHKPPDMLLGKFDKYIKFEKKGNFSNLKKE